MTWTRVTGGAD